MPALASPQWQHESQYNNSRQQAAVPFSAPNQNSRQLRDRSIARPLPQIRTGSTRQGLLPTPDPTIASCISDEDVARQLIALGDAPTFSMGRTSGSTLDDAFSGAADAASSVGATSDSDEYDDHEVDLSKARYAIAGSAGPDGHYNHGHVQSEDYEGSDGPPEAKKLKTKQSGGSGRPKGSHTKSGQGAKSRNSLTGSKTTSAGAGKPHAGAAPVRKSSGSMLNFQHQLAADEEDLSSKPRCQRCRKSKKGCDRQRPCQRCKDAGIGVDGCVSEDEGNGRKGRYGRHMGVVVKKSAEGVDSPSSSSSMPGLLQAAVSIGNESAGEKSKKRKR